MSGGSAMRAPERSIRAIVQLEIDSIGPAWSGVQKVSHWPNAIQRTEPDDWREILTLRPSRFGMARSRPRQGGDAAANQQNRPPALRQSAWPRRPPGLLRA
jgi:hypothetical protein